MTFHAAETDLASLSHEFRLELFARQTECDIHEGTAILIGMALVEAFRSIDGAVEQIGFLLVALSHLRQAALFENPVRDFADHVDAESRRRIVERVLLIERVVAQDLGQGLRAVLEQRASGDDERHAGWAEVFLHAGIYEGKAAEVERARKHIRRHIGEQRHIPRIWYIMILSTIYSIIVAKMDIGSLGIYIELLLSRDVAVAAFLARGSDTAGAEYLCFIVAFLSEAAGQHIVARMLFRGIVQRHHGELMARTALQEQDLIIVAEPHELEDVGLGLVVYSFILFRTMADFEDRHATAIEIQELGLSLFQNVERQHGWARIEVVDTICFHGNNLLAYFTV